MKLICKPYLTQHLRWTKTGRHILAQYDDQSVVVYQAYRPAIGDFAAYHGYFGGEFSFNRMSWIKPNFLWMMYRSGWGTKQGQEVVLAIWIKRPAFDEILTAVGARHCLAPTVLNLKFMPATANGKKLSSIPKSDCNGTRIITHQEQN